MTEEGIRNWVSWIRYDDARIKVFVHKKCDEKGLNNLFWGTYAQKYGECPDNDAHIIGMSSIGNVVAYRIHDTIWVIPATIRAVVNNNDGKLAFYFDYPCDMKEEDLVGY